MFLSTSAALMNPGAPRPSVEASDVSRELVCAYSAKAIRDGASFRRGLNLSVSRHVPLNTSAYPAYFTTKTCVDAALKKPKREG
jgi:hypothetical protein